MSQELNKNKIYVGLGALLATIVAVVMWFWKLKYKKNISVVLLGIITAISILLWVWYANLPAWQDSDKPLSEIEQSWDTITKGDLR
jgi:phosphatidylserine synthase